MISAEELVGEELAEWYSLTPMERWRESAKLWEVYLSLAELEGNCCAAKIFAQSDRKLCRCDAGSARSLRQTRNIGDSGCDPVF
jgi:hypothetical protein